VFTGRTVFLSANNSVQVPKETLSTDFSEEKSPNVVVLSPSTTGLPRAVKAPCDGYLFSNQLLSDTNQKSKTMCYSMMPST